MYPKSLLKGFPKGYQKGNHIYISVAIFLKTIYHENLNISYN